MNGVFRRLRGCGTMSGALGPRPSAFLPWQPQQRSRKIASPRATQYVGELAIIRGRVKQIDNRAGEFVPHLRAHQGAVLLQLNNHEQKSEDGDAVSR